MFRKIGLALLAVGLPLCALAGAKSKFADPITLPTGQKVLRAELDNGLKVMMVVNKNAPDTAVYHWVRAGSLHETPGVTGIAHLFEHMMFRPALEGETTFKDRIVSLGGGSNANTRFEGTQYTTNIPHDQIEQALAFEAHRFKSLTATDALLDVEREAVRSEYMTKLDANPMIDLWDTFYRKGYADHPYSWMIVGERGDLDAINAEACRQFFDLNYRPNQVGLIISGDFDPNQVLAWVEKHYGDWEKGPKREPVPNYKGKHQFTLAEGKLASQSRDLLVGYRTDHFDADNFYELTLLNHIFFGSEYSLANRRLVFEDKLAANAGEFNFSYDNGSIKALLSLLPNTEIEQAVEGFLKLNDDFRALSADELAAYERELKVSMAENIERNTNLTDTLSLFWGKYGSLETLAQLLDKDHHADKARLQKLIDRWFKRDNMIVVKNRWEVVQ